MEKTVLLVDDEKDIREVLSISLTDSGYTVDTAENGKDALRIFKKVTPAVVLADIKMPDMDGIALLQQIKQIDPDTEVIMITGHGDMDLAIKSLKYKAADFITKPIDDDTLRKTLESAFEKISRKERFREVSKNWAVYDVLMNELIQEEVMVVGPDYRILDMNDTLLDKLGVKRDDAVGQYCYETVYHQKAPCSGENQQCRFFDTIETQKPSKVTHIRRDKNNNELYFSVSFYPFFIDDEVIGAFELCKDISEEFNIQKVMMQQEKLAAIGRLSAGVAHEINNPLTTILTTSMLIQEDIEPDDPIYRELETITNESLRCRKIVTSLLDFARQTKPVQKLNNINDIVMESIVLTRKQAVFNDVTLAHNLPEEIPFVRVDKDQIQQAVINLILNAIEATDPEGKITVSTRTVDQTFQPWYYKKHFPPDEVVEITVSDTGKGIPQDILDKIFDPFFTTKESGTGLGLAVTHGIFEQHKGIVDVKSEQGHGTTFTIKLPAYKGSKDGR